MERIDHAQIAIDSIDAALESPPISLEHALMHAVIHNRMTIEEANDCLDAYEKAFNKK